jgi:hypothetical protein
LSLFLAPALVKIGITLLLVLVLSRKLPLFVCLFAGTVVLGIWMKMPLVDVGISILRESTSADTLLLAVVIILILVLSGFLKETGQLERIVTSFHAISSDARLTMAALPALIGLLPMPGGALFSAPMVESASAANNIKPELKVAVNYWFRHIWEYWWPLYPGIILSISLFGLDASKLMAANIPLTVGAVIAGIIFILRHVSEATVVSTGQKTVRTRELIREVEPIAVVILVFAAVQGSAFLAKYYTGQEWGFSKYGGLVVGLAAAIALVIRQNSLTVSEVRRVVLRPGILTMVMVIFAIMSFKGMLTESQAIVQVKQELAAYRIPPLVIIGLLPFISGVVTGIAIGFVGASFPLVTALIPAGHSPFPYAVLAYGLGYMGMMLSPVHLCLIVTREYFGADMIAGYKYLWKPACFSMAWTLGLFVLYKVVLG